MGVQEDEQMLSDADGAIAEGTWPEPKGAAARLGVSQALLSHYEKGIRECGLDFVTRAAKLYHVTCDYLLGYSESRTGVDRLFLFRMSWNRIVK